MLFLGDNIEPQNIIFSIVSGPYDGPSTVFSAQETGSISKIGFALSK